MNDKIRTLLGLIGSLLLASLGTYRIFTNDLMAMPLLIAYIFSITGLIGLVVNTVKFSRIART